MRYTPARLAFKCLFSIASADCPRGVCSRCSAPYLCLVFESTAPETVRYGADPRAVDWGLVPRRLTSAIPAAFGLIASLDDHATHWVLQTAISSLNRLTHRGAIASDGKTGDGCGLLIKQPTAFLRAVGSEAGFKLAPLFASGLVFLNRDPAQAALARKTLTAQLQLEKLRVAGFRQLPLDPSACGPEALKSLPVIEQVFVNAGNDIDEATFNRKLYLARRRSEKTLESDDPVFYLPSLSASTIVYKGMVMPQYLAQFYPDLKDPRMEASVVVFHQRFSTNTLAAVAACASVPVSRSQRRDQHGAGQPQLGRGARAVVPLAGAAGFVGYLAAGVFDRFGFAVARQHAGGVADGRARSHACDARVGAAGVAVGGHDRPRFESFL